MTKFRRYCEPFFKKTAWKFTSKDKVLLYEKSFYRPCLWSVASLH